MSAGSIIAASVIMSRALAPGGELIVFGALSTHRQTDPDKLTIPVFARSLIYETKTVRGFWLFRWFTETDLSVYEDDALLAKMRKAGCAQVLIGFESPTPDALGDAIKQRGHIVGAGGGQLVERLRRQHVDAAVQHQRGVDARIMRDRQRLQCAHGDLGTTARHYPQQQTLVCLQSGGCT